MMKLFISVILPVLMLVLTGCGNPTADLFVSQQNHAAKANGSPFRWKAESIGGGAMSMTRVLIDLPHGDTKADSVLKKDILIQIKKIELARRRDVPELDEVRLLPDGREVWILKSQGQGIAYVVTLKSSPRGGTNYSITGPEMFRRG